MPGRKIKPTWPADKVERRKVATLEATGETFDALAAQREAA